MKYLYLDQNHWSRIERVYNHLVEDSEISEIIQLIENLLEINRIKIIIDFHRLKETSQREDSDSRKRITDLIFKWSKGFYVIPCFFLEEYEIKNYFYRRYGLKEFDVKKLAVSDDVGYLFCGRPNFTAAALDKDQLKKVNTLMNEYISRPEFILSQFNKFSKINESDRQLQVQKAENARFPLRDILDKRQRKKYLIKENFGVLLRKIMETFKITDDFLDEISEEERLKNLSIVWTCLPLPLLKTNDRINFMKEFPLIYTHTTLVSARDLDLRRPIQPGDNIDIVSYVVPIVYFDFIVGEKYFINLARQQKLDQEFGCILINRLEDLKPILQNLIE